MGTINIKGVETLNIKEIKVGFHFITNKKSIDLNNDVTWLDGNYDRDSVAHIPIHDKRFSNVDYIMDRNRKICRCMINTYNWYIIIQLYDELYILHKYSCTQININTCDTRIAYYSTIPYIYDFKAKRIKCSKNCNNRRGSIECASCNRIQCAENINFKIDDKLNNVTYIVVFGDSTRKGYGFCDLEVVHMY